MLTLHLTKLFLCNPPNICILIFILWDIREKNLKNKSEFKFCCMRHSTSPFFWWHGAYDHPKVAYINNSRSNDNSVQIQTCLCVNGYCYGLPD
jgi:hypothetical protein